MTALCVRLRVCVYFNIQESTNQANLEGIIHTHEF